MNPLKRAAAAFAWSATWAANLLGTMSGSYPSLDPQKKDIFPKMRPRALTSNQLLAPTLGTLSAQCRYIERSTPLGRAVCEGLVADVVGTGIALRPNSGDSQRDLALWDEFELWAESAMVDGRSLWQWQAVVQREMATSGAGLARWVYLSERITQGRIPWALLPLEIEWFSPSPVATVPAGNCYVRGIECDLLGRPVRYHLRHPEDTNGKGEAVPAELIQHVFELRRPGQLHGEPSLAIAVERSMQDSRLVETELRAAVATAAPAIAISSEMNPAGDNPDNPAEQVTDIPAGATVHLLPGETAVTLQNNRPSQLIAPFRESLSGDVAAACRVSRSWLSRDPSKANYSSLRADQLLSKRITQPLKEIVGEGTAGNAFKKLFPLLMLKRGYAMPATPELLARAMRYLLRPDQPEYVDPTKDIAAAVSAIANNLSTYDIELAARGRDSMDIFRARQRENAMLTSLGLPIPQPDTKPAPVPTDEKPSVDDVDDAAAQLLGVA